MIHANISQQDKASALDIFVILLTFQLLATSSNALENFLL